ncbi:CvpA family protein [Limnobacter sp.]|uniref:CvpA family protein n=1 Tax=Limnobacter sp. TaxID=2003368 RepID=UPI002587A6B3|nr:CvpA family protein [Limnobacter sp.]
MTVFDYIAIAIVGLSVVLGLFRGMLKEVLSLANWIVAFWLANHYGDRLVVYLDWAEGLSPAMKALVGCAGTFFAAMIVGAILIGLLGRIVSAAGLGFADRGLGGMFGAARGCFIVLVLVTAAGFTSLPKMPFWTQAKLSPVAVDVIKEVKPHLPETVAKWVRY